MKIDPFLLLIPAALFMGPDPGYSQARPADTLLTLTDAVQRAVSDNAQLSSLRAKRDAMLERPGQAKALPNPMFIVPCVFCAVEEWKWKRASEKPA